MLADGEVEVVVVERGLMVFMLDCVDLSIVVDSPQ